MNLRRLAFASLVVTVVAVPISLGAQTSRPATKAPSRPYTPPRTPWGDPDLQGNYTNVYENGTPLERPGSVRRPRARGGQGRGATAIKRATQERTINNFQGPIHAPDHWWQDALSSRRGAQAWLVVDPTDGKIPPLTAEAQRRHRRGSRPRAASGRGPADSSRTAVSTIAASRAACPGSMMPSIYGNSYQIVQGPGFVAITYEMIHETRVIPIEAARPHVGRRQSHLDMGDARGHWEGDTLVVETTQLPGAQRLPQRQPRARCGWSSASRASRRTR